MNVSHEISENTTTEWLTPPWIINSFPKFTLDPCAPSVRPWNTAKIHYTKDENGLLLPWFGSVWCNPPYSRDMGPWFEKMVAHKNVLTLVFARTETELFFNYVWSKAYSILFIKRRVIFHKVDGTKASGSPGAPSVIISYNAISHKKLEKCGIEGRLIKL
jgi:hypothetical protein